MVTLCFAGSPIDLSRGYINIWMPALCSRDAGRSLGKKFVFLSSTSRRTLFSRIPYVAKKLLKTFSGRLICLFSVSRARWEG